MHITGMLRVRNEARWIERVIASILPVCDRVLVMDDHSDDGTPDLCRAMGAVVLPSPFVGTNEARDKNWLLCHAGVVDWILAIDGDEILTQPEALLEAMNTPARCITMPILYLWDREDQIRTDGVYGRFRRHSAFRPNGAQYAPTSHGGNFHCGNVPVSLRDGATLVNSPLLHLGYMNREDRLRKYAWYNAQDPGNRSEDLYRHVAQGDRQDIPADAHLMHAGPLKLEALCTTA